MGKPLYIQHPNSASTTLNSWQGSTTTTNRYYKKECIYTTSPNVPRGAKISNTSFPSLKASTTCVCDHKKVYSPHEKCIPRSYTTLLYSNAHVDKSVEGVSNRGHQKAIYSNNGLKKSNIKSFGTSL